MKKSLFKKEILRNRINIKNVFKSSFWIRNNGLKLLYKNNNLLYNRVLFTTIKGFKKAVFRNRQKRLLREIYRNTKIKLKSGFDMIFILFPGQYNYKQRAEQFSELMNKAKLFI